MKNIKMKRIFVSVLLGLGAVSSVAYAEKVEETPPPLLPAFAPNIGENVANDFARTQSETQLLRAQIDRAKAQVELATLKNQARQVEEGPVKEKEEVTTIEEELPAAPIVVEAEPVKEAPKSDPNIIPAPPEVVAIFGVGKDLYASLRSHNGRTFDAAKGDRIDDGYRVQGISPDVVTLTHGGKRYQLRVISSGAMGVNLNREIPINPRQ